MGEINNIVLRKIAGGAGGVRLELDIGRIVMLLEIASGLRSVRLELDIGRIVMLLEIASGLRSVGLELDRRCVVRGGRLERNIASFRLLLLLTQCFNLDRNGRSFTRFLLVLPLISHPPLLLLPLLYL